jgi:hypothetical protein
MRDPERTIVYDIIANGAMLPDPEGKRYGQRDRLREWAREAWCFIDLIRQGTGNFELYGESGDLLDTYPTDEADGD